MKEAVVRRERFPLLLFLVLTASLFALARPIGAPWALRSAAALVSVFVLPGAALALLWPGATRTGWPAALALAVPLSLVPVLGAATFGSAFGWGVLPLSAAYLFGVFVLCLASLVLAWRREPEHSPPRRVTLVFAALALAAVALVGRASAPSGPYTDGPDHIATVNEILGTGEFFPNQGLVPPGAVDRPDPRKGIFPAGLALAASLAGVPATHVWRLAPAVLLLSWLAGILVLGRRVGLGWWGALLAGELAFLFTGGHGGAWIVRIGYGAHLGLAVAWAATWVLLGLVEDFQRSGAILFGLLVAVATAVHPMAPAFVYLPALLMLLLLARDRTRAARVAGALAAGLAIAAPVLTWRILEAWGPTNPLHARTMPALVFTSHASMLWPPEILRALGWTGVFGLGLLIPVARSDARPTAKRYLLAATIASLGPAVIPGCFDLVARTTSSLPIKLLYLNPFFLVIGAYLGGSWAGWRRWPRLAVTALLLVLLPGALTAFAPARVRGWRPPGIDAALEVLRAIPDRQTVAADPLVSSLIAAETPHDPVTVSHQHGHPLDPDGLVRLDQLGAILSPWMSAEDARSRLHAVRARYVLIADGGEAVLRREFGAASGGALDAARIEKFSDARAAFRLVSRVPGWAVYRATDSRADSILAPVRPPVIGAGRGLAVAARDGAWGDVRLLAIELPGEIVRGRDVALILWWSREGPGGEWPVEAHLRFTPLDAPVPSKVKRIAGILARGERDLAGPHRIILAPFGGAWPSAFWPRGVAVADTARVSIPTGLPEGRYAVSVRIAAQPMFTRIAFRDLWSEEDQWQGGRIDTVLVR